MVLSKSTKQHQLKKSAPAADAKRSLRDETAPRKASEYWFAILATIAVIVAAEWVVSNKFIGSDQLQDSDEAPHVASLDIEIANSNFLTMLAEKLNTQWPDADVGQVSDDLLLQASDAVANEDHAGFADSMRMLGVNALRDQDIDSASVYLDEALSVFEELEDDMGIASVELLRGELNLKRRAQARRAAYAYDAMQLARWKVSRGRFHEAVEELNTVVNENLALNRYGAAAAAYQTLYKGYAKHGQMFEAQQAGIEIVKLHSSSGRPLKAQAMLESLINDGLDEQSVLQLKQSSTALQVEYEHSVTQMGQARDYQQLYNYFISAGDPVRAWQFRLKSQNSLRGVTQRAMHRRQTGVLALLYTSNDHMKNAQKSLDRASQIFDDNGRQRLSDESAQMREKVF